ncbi:hypothetical protein Tco_0833680 [Tanacetum coccineum]
MRRPLCTPPTTMRGGAFVRGQAPGDLRETLQPNLTHHDGESPQRKALGREKCLTYGESSHRNSQTREETQLSESESCDRRRRPKKRNPSPTIAPRDTRPSQNASVFSRLRREGDKPTRRRSPVRTTVFTRIGHRDGNVFTRLGERRKNVHSRLGPEVASRRRHASERRSANSNRSAEDPNRRKKDARSLIHSYVTCFSERQREIEEEWYAVDHASRMPLARTKEAYLSEDENDQGGHWKSRPKKRRSNEEDDLSHPWLCEETDPFTARIRYFEVPKKTRMPANVKTYDGTGDPEDHLERNDERDNNLSKGGGGSSQSVKKESPANVETPQNKPQTELRQAARFQKPAQSGQAARPVYTSHKTPKEILAMETVKLKAPPPMIGPVENRNKNKFCEFHDDKGHSTDECIHLRRQIEEAVTSGQLSHLVKEIKQGGKQGEHAKATKKRETPNKEKATSIFMISITIQRYHRPPGSQKSPSNLTHNSLNAQISSSGRNSNNPQQYHNISGVKMVVGAPNRPPPQEPTATKGIKVEIHPEYPKQTVTIGGSLSEKGRMELCNLLKDNLDIFAWKPADMIGVPRSIVEHRLNIHEGYQPIRQKRRGQAPDRNTAIQEKVAKLVEAEIMREVHYYDWLSNPVMVKKHNGSWRMRVDFTDLNKSCPKDIGKSNLSADTPSSVS